MKHIVILILAITSLWSCKKDEHSIHFQDKKEVAEIPFIYSPAGHIVVKCIIKKDTFNFVLDTGSGISLISPEIEDDGFISKISAVDIHSNKKEIQVCKLDSMQCGEIAWRNLNVGKTPINFSDADGIIGRDILKNISIKIDNENNTISLAKNSDLLEMKGIRKDFDPSKFYLNLTVEKDSLEGDFLFDTGYVGDISIDSALVNSTFPEDSLASLWKIPEMGLFQNPDLEKNGISSFSLKNIYLDSTILMNVICEYNQSNNKNLIGSVFLRRFRSITFDYQNHAVFFELPKNAAPMSFSGKRIYDAPASVMNPLFSYINSFGIVLSDEYPFKVFALMHNEFESIIQIGDTLVGIDNVIFDEYVYTKRDLKSSLTLETNVDKQKEMVYKTLYQRNIGTFHFFKNDNLVSVKANRKQVLTTVPNSVYTYNNNNKNNRYFFYSYTSDPNSSFRINILWSTLSGEEIKITSYKDGKEQHHWNKPNLEE